MKTLKLTKKQLEYLRVNGRVWGKKYYYTKVVEEIVKYREIYYETKNEKRLMGDDYATLNKLWKFAKIK